MRSKKIGGVKGKMFEKIEQVLEVYEDYMRKYLEKIEELKTVSQIESRRWTENEHEALMQVHEKLLTAKELLNLSSQEVQEIQDKIGEQISHKLKK